MVEVSTRFTVEVTHDGDVWVADVPALAGAHTQAGNLTRLDEAIREVIALVEDLPEGAEAALELDYEYEGLDAVARAASLIGRHRAELDRVQSALADQTTTLVHELSELGWSVRDAAHLLNISPGRVSQIRGNEEPSSSLLATATTLAELTTNAAREARGETQLRSVAETAGMLQHVDFDARVVNPESKHSRPDMVVSLPGGKSIAIDAKIPLESLDGEPEDVRAYVTRLGSPSYWNDLEPSPEMIVAFVPSEAHLSALLARDPSIMEYAFSRHVALASPVTLYSVLKSVAVAWRHEAIVVEARAAFDVTSDLPERFLTGPSASGPRKIRPVVKLPRSA
jgi:DNA recombination protein RmuC